MPKPKLLRNRVVMAVPGPRDQIALLKRMGQASGLGASGLFRNALRNRNLQLRFEF